MGSFSYHPSKKSIERRRKRQGGYLRSRNHRWCENHPLSTWADGYAQCAEGWRKQEPCKQGK